MARTSIARLTSSTSDLAGGRSKLALLELLLEVEDKPSAASAVLEWLSDELGVARSLCAALVGEVGRCAGIAGHGFSSAQIEGFSLELDDPGNPLVKVLSADRPVRFEAGAGAPADQPFRRQPFVAFPLHGFEDGAPIPLGLLLTSEVSPQVARGVEWAAAQLARRLWQIRSLRLARDNERRLGREQRLLDGLIDAVNDPILLTDGDGRMIIANSRAENLFATGDVQSEGRRRAIALNNMLFSSALAQRAIAPGELTRRELLLVDPADGSDLLFELLSATVQGDREGTGAGIVSILRNVTDLRRATEEIEGNYRKLRAAEADVRAERDRLNLIIDSVADPILVTNPAGNLVLVNDPAERLFASPSAAPDGARQRAIQGNDVQLSSFVSKLLLAGDSLRWRGELTLTDPASGAAIPMEAVSGKVLSEHGEVTAIVTLLHDQTEALERARLYDELEGAKRELEGKVREATAELVRQNELLRRQHLQLEQASELKTQFLANMSHEFRTPLNAILGYTSMLLQGVYGPLDARQARGLGRVDSNAQHLLSIINDILDIARIEAGKMPVHATEFPLAGLVAEILSELEPLISRTSLEIQKDLAPALPTVFSDRQKIKQVVSNLLANALKFTPQGSVTVRIRQQESEIAISVIDTGIGIAPGDQQKVFEDFRQVDSTPARAYGGTGLGLSICRRLAATLDGRIELSSELGRGSTFSFFFPMRWRRE
ncbi:MAG: PAS domain-containing sensor histidine kinase [Deltaproteobacteria bacterium]